MEEEKFVDASEKAEEIINKVIHRMAIPMPIAFKIIGSNKLKGLIKIQKVSDVYHYITKLDVLIIVNNIYSDAMDEESIEILANQELDRLQFDINSGKIKLSKPEFATSVGVIKRFGMEAVARANKLEDAFGEQKDDMEAMQNIVNTYKDSGLLQESGENFLG